MLYHDVVEKAARAQCNALGITELRLIVYKQPQGIAEEVEGEQTAKSVTDQIFRLMSA